MTPYELSVATRSYKKRKEFDMEERHMLVWMGEYYHRQKKLPPLYEALGKEKPVPKKMTDEEMLEKIKMLNAKFGGTVEE